MTLKSKRAGYGLIEIRDASTAGWYALYVDGALKEQSADWAISKGNTISIEFVDVYSAPRRPRASRAASFGGLRIAAPYGIITPAERPRALGVRRDG